MYSLLFVNTHSLFVCILFSLLCTQLGLSWAIPSVTVGMLFSMGRLCLGLCCFCGYLWRNVVCDGIALSSFALQMQMVHLIQLEVSRHWQTNKSKVMLCRTWVFFKELFFVIMAYFLQPSSINFFYFCFLLGCIIFSILSLYSSVFIQAFSQ